MPEASETVIYKGSDEGICQIIINRPTHRNAVNSNTGQNLYDAFIAFDGDPTQKVCVFSGAYDTFCAGFDLHEVADSDNVNANSSGMKSQSQSHLQPVSWDEAKSHYNRAPMGPSRLQLTKPVIAAVSGYAVAGGLELSLLADMRIVEEDAIFGVFCRRFGVPLIDGGTVRLPATVGFGRAMDMILTGRPVSANEALSMGLANRVVRRGEAVEKALEIARDLTKFPQRCMNLDRRSAYYASFDARSMEDALRNEFELGIQCVGEESLQGAKRFRRGDGRHGGSGKGLSSKL